MIKIVRVLVAYSIHQKVYILIVWHHTKAPAQQCYIAERPRKICRQNSQHIYHTPRREHYAALMGHWESIQRTVRNHYEAISSNKRDKKLQLALYWYKKSGDHHRSCHVQ